MRSNYCQNYLGHLSPKASSSHISLDIWANMKISSPKARATYIALRINQWVLSLNSFGLIANTTLCCRIISELTEVFFSKPDIVTTYYCIKSFYWSQFWVASTSPSAFSTYIRRGRERIEQICRCVTHIRLMWISRGVPKNFSRIAHGFCWSTWSIQYRAEVGVLDSSQASSQVYKIPS